MIVHVVNSDVNRLNANVPGTVECGPGDIITVFFHGDRSGYIKLTDAELTNIILARAPSGREARELYFTKLLGEVENLSPCLY